MVLLPPVISARSNAPALLGVSGSASLFRYRTRPFSLRKDNQSLHFRREKVFHCSASSEDDPVTGTEHSSRSQDDAEQSENASGSGVENATDEAVEEPLKISSGPLLPGVKASGDIGQIPRSVIEVLRDQVFGFDTFFVTAQEPYEGGILFKGNLRGDPSKSYTKINGRLQGKFGDQYRLFLLSNPEDEKPVAIVTLKELVEPDPATIPEWLAASAFGLASLYTIVLRNSPSLQLDPLSSMGNYQLLIEGIPGAVVTLAILAAHEAGHIFAAKNMGAKLGVPYLVPSWQIGSFGSITRIISTLPNRQDLLKIAAAGPLIGTGLAILLLLIGFAFPPSEGQGIIVNATAFHDSLLVGTLGKLFMGDSLKEGASVGINPLVLWAWAGLLINGINSIPVGELDGGRISQALWGRKVWSRVNGVTIALLGFSALFSDVSLYWVVLVIFLQRGPITPQAEEISSPNNEHAVAGVAVLLLSLLICLPFPFPLS
ncbi:hypothetical protein GOP47_0000791 [Adiantum capillus-veneris]|uniref:Peptidase M50 domain-containing protein n=1 Tax=Adiantum capillus-veneris TaxID=13818 RepID=A0A9D4VFE5_ADICA|nr:hypothetical protein GOP47_0000790 [Adiantum capillus-veneris]KAI5084622.1 hypothetical protein GOP47_0000791 [Adiantum capillus-veneris]